ncbi:hypothetical protein [Roseobacter cerasinus]|uniref:hypothetical protein n=1 Tax=Roseobacter cerasinus TaxID=2602289 RepID=UPI001357A4AC|nr:hypothetical protein [Roseobacter cerasinus]
MSVILSCRCTGVKATARQNLSTNHVDNSADNFQPSGNFPFCEGISALCTKNRQQTKHLFLRDIFFCAAQGFENKDILVTDL